MSVKAQIKDVTDRIAARSELSRRDYLDRLDKARDKGVHRAALSCGNLAHGFAACGPTEKALLAGDKAPNLGIVTSYNDMLSAHQPYETYPDIIRAVAREMGATAQVAGGVPAMCDGVTQGQTGMDL
jgi:phosphogluconate dehydratase